MTRRKARRDKNKRRSPPGHVARSSAPDKRLHSLFDLIDDITVTADRISRAGAGQPTLGGERVELALFLRGLNALKSARLLLAQAHWENASAVIRQLFELVVNVGHIASFEDRDQALLRFATFGVLQNVRTQLASLEYGLASGRDVDRRRMRELQAMLDNAFPDFRRESKSGVVKWPHSWSGQTVSKLAEASPNRLRVDQYRILYSGWSEQIHGAPGAVLDSMPTGLSRETWVEELVRSDDVSTVETGTMAVSLFLELWLALPPAEAPKERCVEWAGRAFDVAIEYGAPAPRADLLG